MFYNIITFSKNYEILKNFRSLYYIAHKQFQPELKHHNLILTSLDCILVCEQNLNKNFCCQHFVDIVLFEKFIKLLFRIHIELQICKDISM